MAIDKTERRVAFSCSVLPLPRLLLAGSRPIMGPQQMVHRAPSFYLFHYVTAGRGWVRQAADTARDVETGGWFFCFPGQNIRYEQYSNTPWRYRWIGFQGDGAGELLARAGILPETLVRQDEPDPEIEPLLQRMLEELESGQIAANLEADALLLRLLSRLIKRTPPNERSRSRVKPGGLGEYIESACQFMANHFAEGIHAADVVAHVGFERTYFSKVFSQSTGTTLQEYLSMLRQGRAEDLLRNTDLLVETIADAVGFGEAKAFSRFFKQRVGLSPRNWRRVEIAKNTGG